MRVAILMAAGRSRRFGSANKLLTGIAGKPMMRHAIEAGLAGQAGRMIVVVGADAVRTTALARRVGGRRVTIVRARDYHRGLSASLRAGLLSLRPTERDLLILLGDAPFVSRALIARLRRCMRPGDTGVRPMAGDVPGHPVVLRRPDKARIAQLTGDRGLGALLGGAVRRLAVRGRATTDIDTRREYLRHRNLRPRASL